MTEKFIKHHHILNYENPQLQHTFLGITTREDGLSSYPERAFNMARYINDDPSNIDAHQETLSNIIQMSRENWVFPIQTHENKVVEVDQSDRGTNIIELSQQLHGVDGMYSYSRDILLTMCYADCVPIYFYSEKNNYIGLAHAGWRGTVGQIVVEMLKKVNFPRKDLRIVIGPATSTSYEINEDVRKQFEALNIDSSRYIFYRGKNRYGIDLKEANALLLEANGIDRSQIDITQYETSEDLSLFFSYRVEKGNTGRMLAYIGQR
ncbi:peptidoglycan editing factor PgeF [Staphylococcus sp. SQ8-PEA]|uniref:Purine nucleoside phosphorylase n=1 Tax=Staphylococcus marylandisciuri TaxID=2981529 RepID=A0ABT2QP19_9STAP|nr:peptidoglycan editing factor PgeF [Staphylococcus marylandisciuri]MCU5745723.1 peptidoglycan editing factor PgeF [Staphylococcus marylandisciuri]